MSDTQKPMQLTKDDCAALRAATSYVVRLEGEACSLELTKRVEATREGFGRTNVDLERTIVGRAGSLTQAFFSEAYAGGAFQALGRIVRAGDVLLFYAYEDNSNDYLRAARIPAEALSYHPAGYDRLYLDELCVDVYRPGRTGRERKVVERLVLCHSVCPQNTARAVRPDARRGRQYPAEVA